MKKSKVISLFLSAVMAVNLLSAVTGVNEVEAAGTAADVVNLAKSQIGYYEKASNSNLDDFTANRGSANYTKYARDIGVANGQAWCATFVWWVMQSAGVPSTAFPARTTVTRDWFNERGLYRARGTYTPKAGDYIIFGNVEHCGIVESVSGNTVYTIEGNSADCVRRNSYSLSNSYILGYGIINYSGSTTSTTTAYDPEGTVDYCTSKKNGTLWVRGWAFDRDTTSTSIGVHVYIGGQAGTAGAEGHAITANTERVDVHNAYGVGKNHGFDATLDTKKTGKQEVYIYAINAEGGTNNPQIGHFTVNIGATQSPIGVVDGATSNSPGVVSVSGWTYDKDDISKSLSVHVYIGGQAGTAGAEGHVIIANTQRTDVNKAYGVGDNHGYRADIQTNKIGTQEVYVYAIDDSGKNDNTFIGKRTVNISKKIETTTEKVTEQSTEQKTEKTTEATTEQRTDATTERSETAEDSVEHSKDYDNVTTPEDTDEDSETLVDIDDFDDETEDTTDDKQLPKKGDILTDTKNMCLVRVVSNKRRNLTVQYIMAIDKNAKKVTVPNQVSIDGFTYKVTSIANNAFCDNTKLTNVTIGNSVVDIGDNAFKNCKKLKSVTIPKSVERIGKNAFKSCKSLKKITIKSTGLIKIGKNAFKNIGKKATILVPKSKKTVYKRLLKKAGYK